MGLSPFFGPNWTNHYWWRIATKRLPFVSAVEQVLNSIATAVQHLVRKPSGLVSTKTRRSAFFSDDAACPLRVSVT